MNKWSYGDSWEKFPIREGEVWTEANTMSAVAVWDIFNGMPEFMLAADMVYCDPPWNLSNISSFYTKAGKSSIGGNYLCFANVLFEHIVKINPNVCYLEIGKQNINLFLSKFKEIFQYVQNWDVTYYKKNKSFLIRGSNIGETDVDFTGIDDDYIPGLVLLSENFSCVADLCMGRGLTGITAYKFDKRFVGTELNKRRLAVMIDKVTALGGKFAKQESL